MSIAVDWDVKHQTKQTNITSSFECWCFRLCQFIFLPKLIKQSTCSITLLVETGISGSSFKVIQKWGLYMSSAPLGHWKYLQFISSLLFQCAATDLTPTLQLCHTWGEMIIMLAQYTRYRANHFLAQPPVCTHTDLSYIHSYLTTKEWLKVHKIIGQCDDKKIIHLWVS